MGVDVRVRFVAGVDAEEAHAGASLVERHRAGAFGGPMRAGASAESSLMSWFDEHAPGGLGAFDSGGPLAGKGARSRLVVGVLVAELSDPGQTKVAGPLTKADVEGALARARAGLRDLGVEAEPRLFLLRDAS